MSVEVIVHESCGNIFADLGIPHADELYAKAVLSIVIERSIRQRGMSAADAARCLGLPPAEVNSMVRREFTRYSIDQLVSFLDVLGWRERQM